MVKHGGMLGGSFLGKGAATLEVFLMGNMDVVWRGLAARLSPKRRPGHDKLAFLEIHKELVAQGYCS